MKLSLAVDQSELRGASKPKHHATIYEEDKEGSLQADTHTINLNWVAISDRASLDYASSNGVQ